MAPEYTCDTDQYLVVAKGRKILAVSKLAAQEFDVEIFTLSKLNETEFKKQYCIKISNRSAALESSKDSQVINTTWENIKENIKTQLNCSPVLYILKQNKPWFDEESLDFFLIEGSRLKCSEYRIQTKAM